MAYQYKTSKGLLYYLHSMIVKLKGSGVKQTIYWFARKQGKHSLDDMPRGYKVITSRRTGLPLLKKG